jgi:hypothetical protein
VGDLGSKIPGVKIGYPAVRPGVVPEFETLCVQLADLLPSHVVFPVGEKGEAFGDEEGGSETEPF